jgi:hypothetical protein
MSADAAGRRAEALRRPGEIFRLWVGVLAGPLVALAEQEAIYLLVPGACAGGQELPLHLTALLALLLIAGAGVLSLRDWRRAGAEVPDAAGGPQARSRFMAVVGILSSIIFGLAVLAHWLATILLGPCQQAL